MLARQGIIPKKDAEKILAGSRRRSVRSFSPTASVFSPSDEDIHIGDRAAPDRDRRSVGRPAAHGAQSQRPDRARRAPVSQGRDRQSSHRARRGTRGARAPGAQARSTWSCPATRISSARSRCCSRITCSPTTTCSDATTSASPTAARASTSCRSAPARSPACPIPIDRAFVARQLGFHRISENSIDAVSDRDFIAEFLAATAILFTHLSRLCADLTLWATAEFGFVELPDEFSTGSSIMPQKKNPDVAELVRGKSRPDLRQPGRRADGDEGPAARLPERPAGGQGADVRRRGYGARHAAHARGDAPGAALRRRAHARRPRSGFLLATELADFLVEKGLPFREAHGVVGARRAALPEERRSRSTTLTLTELRRFSPRFDRDVQSPPDARGGGRAPPRQRRHGARERRAPAAEDRVA